MKRLMAAVMVAGLLGGMAAADEVQSLVPEGYWDFWFKPEGRLVDIGSDSAGVVGGSFGIAMNRSVYVGIGCYTLASAVDFGSPNAGKLGSYDLWYTGMTFGYTFFPARVIHGSADLLVGWGESSPRLVSGQSESSDLFVVEPGISLMVNVTKDMEFGFGFAYRFMDGSDTVGLSDSDLGGPSGSVFLRWTEQR